MARQIICVHVGDKYSDDYVLKLHTNCRKNLQEPFIFTILSDKTSYNIDDPNCRIIGVDEIQGVPHNRLWWYKMQAFRPDVIEDENLLLDLDIVIVNDIAKLWNHAPGRLIVCQDFNRHWVPNYQRCNSSVVRFDRSHAVSVWQKWIADPTRHMGKYRGDQDWLDAEISDKMWWPHTWMMSWKWEVFSGGLKQQHTQKYHSTDTRLEPGCSILAFHGKPDPHEVAHEIVIRSWQL